MKQIFVPLIVLLFCVSNVYAQRASRDLFTSNAAPEKILKDKFDAQVKDPVFLKINKNELGRLFTERNNVLKIDVPVKLREINSTAVLELTKFDIVSPQTRFVKKTAEAETDMQFHNLILSYTGKVKGMDNSFVTIIFTEERVIGILITDKETYTLGTTNENNKNEDNYILFQEGLRKTHRDFKCGSETLETPERIKKMMNEYKPGTDNMSPTLLKADIAVDVDFATYNSYGGNLNTTTAWAMAHMAAVSATYIKEINCQLNLSYLRVWTTQDPYTSTSGNQMLNQFRADWINTQSGVPRVVAHLLSRRNNVDVAGIAYVGVLCSTQNGYGLSATLNGAAPNLPNYTYDVETTAHELGHNFGSPHTHYCGWVGGPIDTCSEVDGGCYSGPLRPTVGTIMSYCDISGGSVIMTFGPQPGTLIRNNAEGAGCIVANDRSVLLALPKGGETFRTGNTAAIWWGANSSGNVNIEYTSNNGANWNVIQNNVPAQQRSINWVIPYIASTTQAKVRIYNPSNPAEADTSDANFRIVLSLNTFTANNPPQSTVLNVHPDAVNSYQKFSWGSAGSHPSINYKWKIRRVGQPDKIFLSNNNGLDSSLTLRYSFLDSVRASFNAGDSILTLWSATAYNGIDSTTSSSLILILNRRNSVGVTQISTVVPEKFSLFNNYPNPFNPATNIKFDIAKSSFVKLFIYDSKGAVVSELVNSNLQAGSYNYSFDATKLSSGVYFYRVEAGSFSETKRMILLK
jgi:hypothetical protein